MRKLLKRLAAPAAVAALFGAAPLVAHADIAVEYYTTGYFKAGANFGSVGFGSAGETITAAGPNPTIPLGTLNDGGSNYVTVLNADGLTTSTLTYSFSGDTSNTLTDAFPVQNVDFGTFSFTSTGGAQVFDQIAFHLDIYQIEPGTGGQPAKLVGGIDGTIGVAGSKVVSGDGTDKNGFEITFNPNEKTVPGGDILYTVAPPSGVVSFDSSTDNPITGTISAVPLPATASTGLALLGGLGVLGGVNVLRRRRQMA